jgi:hypothetical protein
MAVPVAGWCPMGCGETLILSRDHVICSWLTCPDPGRADALLGERETEHVVLLRERDFVIQHPLREHRDELFECDLMQRLNELPGPPMPPGRYRVHPEGGGWRWEPLP